MRFRGALLATALVALPIAAITVATSGSAEAQPVTGLYIGGGIGPQLNQNPKVSAGRVFGGATRLDENLGFSGLASVGYGLGNGFRFEVEGNFNRDGVRELAGTGFPTKPQGTVYNSGVMVNALYDLDIGLPWLFPYIGAGAGYEWTNLNNVSFTTTNSPGRFGTDRTSGAFAFQAIAGASYPISAVPGLSATVDYRFMDITGGPRFSGVEYNGGAASFQAIQLHNQFEHSIIFGVRYAFNTATPAAPAAIPVAAPAPSPARSYLVFFDWDKANLTERARQIIKEAADNSTRVQYTRIDVNGYTDTSGTPQYNQGLSVRRAQAVAGELVRDGVPRGAITVQGFGETHLLVPTGAGVREPQNRRVEIVIH